MTDANGWISVAEWLPEEYNEFFIWPRPEFNYTQFTAEWFPKTKEWKCRFYNGYEDENFKCTVTHYKPIDAPVTIEQSE